MTGATPSELHSRAAHTRRIPIAEPVFVGNETEYVLDCMKSGWISSAGKYVELFEDSFAKFCGTSNAIACSTGTAALHLALLAIGIEPGDEVIVPALTFVATANAVRYCGATPVFVDSEAGSWNMDPVLVEKKITLRTKCIIAVHLYGLPADMGALSAIAQRHRLLLVEDAAEAHGAEYRGRRTGSLADVAAFSFYGNKILTTGEGGMVTTDNGAIASQVRLFRGQGMDPSRRYWFPVVGYNYRMTNLVAAVGLGQVETAEFHLRRRREVWESYRTGLADIEGLSSQPELDETRHARWMVTLMLDGSSVRRDSVVADLDERGIETRPVFYPVPDLPPYVKSDGDAAYPVARDLHRRGFSLPTSAALSGADIDYVCESLRRAVARSVPCGPDSER